PADVLATADATTMQSVVDAGATTADPRVFATNHLVLVTPVGNPAGVQALADLDDPSVSYVVCVQTAPCGVLAADLLTGEGVSAEPVSREVDVKAVLSKVTLDEADAGLVYASDAVAAGEDVERIDVPAAEADRTEYLVAPVEQAGEPDLAADWVDLLLSPEGRQVLRDAGFTEPAG
ncbi:MAG TPA: molybdate ABC transporter substrate-binding protein, partial [Nocardioidaceae bacterium]|nr:molybdate ABC transporter substrate-binding protein [Nocardioidaceae bacterium]